MPMEEGATAAPAAKTARRSRFPAFVFLAAQAAALALFGFIIPNDSPFFPRCVFHAITGLYCPGCGTGRGILRMLRGDILGGIRQNWFLLVGLPILALADINAVLALLGREPLVDFDRVKGLAFALLVAVLAYWILRNIPVFPFTLLAPQKA
jgi:hypothetical protein